MFSQYTNSPSTAKREGLYHELKAREFMANYYDGDQFNFKQI